MELQKRTLIINVSSPLLPAFYPFATNSNKGFRIIRMNFLFFVGGLGFFFFFFVLFGFFFFFFFFGLDKFFFFFFFVFSP